MFCQLPEQTLTQVCMRSLPETNPTALRRDLDFIRKLNNDLKSEEALNFSTNSIIAAVVEVGHL